MSMSGFSPMGYASGTEVLTRFSGCLVAFVFMFYCLFIYCYSKGRVWNENKLVCETFKQLFLLFLADSKDGAKLHYSTRYRFAGIDLTVDAEICWSTLDYRQHTKFIDRNRDIGKIQSLEFVQHHPCRRQSQSEETQFVTNLKQNEAQSARAESTLKGVN